MRSLLRLLVVAGLAVALGATAGCDRLLDIILDGHNPHGPAAIQPDSVRGDTTFYSYTFRATETWGWDSYLDGVTTLASVTGGSWILPKAGWSDTQWREIDLIVPNRFRLICVSTDSVTSEETRQRAYAAIERAGAVIEIHLRAGEAGAHPEGVYHPGIEFFDVRHPDGNFWLTIPAEADLMGFIQALDDSTAFDYVFPCRLPLPV